MTNAIALRATWAIILLAGLCWVSGSPQLPVEGLASAVPFACVAANVSSLPFCNRSLTTAARVADLVARLTLPEKLGLLSSTNAAVPRLSLPGFAWGNECLHGAVVTADMPVAGTLPPHGATVFPQPLGLAAGFSAAQVHAVGEAIGIESRALSNAGAAKSDGTPAFLTCWAPNQNIFRDPRWGRGSETYGESPSLTSEMVVAYVSGLQGSGSGFGSIYEVGNNSRDFGSGEFFNNSDSNANGYGKGDAAQYLRVLSTCKHFAAYSLEEVDGESRFWFDAVVGKQDMTDTYLPAFEACVRDAKAAGIMVGGCSLSCLSGE